MIFLPDSFIKLYDISVKISFEPNIIVFEEFI